MAYKPGEEERNEHADITRMPAERCLEIATGGLLFVDELRIRQR